MLSKVLKWSGLILLFLTGLIILVFYIRYGGTGKPFPSQATSPLLPADSLEIVAALPEPPGNLAVSAEGRIFFTYHAESNPEIKVLEWVNGKPVPYPNAAFQHKGQPGQPYFDCIFNVRIDRQNRLWTLDHGFHGLRQPRLLAFDLSNNQLVHQFDIPSQIAGVGSYIQDMQIDSAGEHIFIADIGVVAKKPAIIIYNTREKKARRVLENDHSVQEEPYEINAQGRKMYPLPGHLFWMHPAIDPIALDKQNQWLYYGAMSSDKMFRVQVTDLLDEKLAPEELSRKVELYSVKSQCDGLSMDTAGNIYVTSIEDGAINRIDASRKQRTLIKHPTMRWPDGLSFGPDGYLYIADSDIPDVMMKSKSHMQAAAPYYIFRFKPGTAGIPGQ